MHKHFLGVGGEGEGDGAVKNKFIEIFDIFVQSMFWIKIRTMGTHNLCFGSKIGQIGKPL